MPFRPSAEPAAGQSRHAMKFTPSRIASPSRPRAAALPVLGSPDPAPDRPGRAARKAAGDRGGEALPADVFYRLLLGDIALQRGEPAVAARALSRSGAGVAGPGDRAPRHRSRALRPPAPLATEAASLWQQVEPTARAPGQIIAAVAAGNDVERITSPRRADSAPGWNVPCRRRGVGRHGRRRAVPPAQPRAGAAVGQDRGVTG